MAKFIEEQFRFSSDGKSELVFRLDLSDNLDKSHRIAYLKRMGFVYDKKIGGYKTPAWYDSDVLYVSFFHRLIHTL